MASAASQSTLQEYTCVSYMPPDASSLLKRFDASSANVAQLGVRSACEGPAHGMKLQSALLPATAYTYQTCPLLALLPRITAGHKLVHTTCHSAKPARSWPSMQDRQEAWHKELSVAACKLMLCLLLHASSCAVCTFSWTCT